MVLVIDWIVGQTEQLLWGKKNQNKDSPTLEQVVQKCLLTLHASELCRTKPQLF